MEDFFWYNYLMQRYSTCLAF